MIIIRIRLGQELVIFSVNLLCTEVACQYQVFLTVEIVRSHLWGDDASAASTRVV